MPQTPIFGFGLPASTRALWPRRMTRSTRPGSMRATASRRPMWVVTWMTLTLSVESIIETSGVQRLLVERGRADGLDLAGHRELGGDPDVVVCRVAGHRGQLPERQVLGEQREVDDVDPPGQLDGLVDVVDRDDVDRDAGEVGCLLEAQRVTDDDGPRHRRDVR